MSHQNTLESWIFWISAMFKRLLPPIIKLIVHIGTFPYYRFFQFNTLRPILRIAACTTQSVQYNKLSHLIVRWQTRKLSELQFTSIACAILAAAVISSFSWTSIPDAYWLSPTFWYCSLVLSVLGLLLSAQQVAVLDLLGARQTVNGSRTAKVDIRRSLPLMLTEVRQSGLEAEEPTDGEGVGVWKPRWKMVFLWQCPMMFMSYSVCFYLAGLTTYVCTPLIRGLEWSAEVKIAVVYLIVFSIASGAFMLCSFWVYHYVDLEHEFSDTYGMEIET